MGDARSEPTRLAIAAVWEKHLPGLVGKQKDIRADARAAAIVSAVLLPVSIGYHGLVLTVATAAWAGGSWIRRRRAKMKRWDGLKNDLCEADQVQTSHELLAFLDRKSHDAVPILDTSSTHPDLIIAYRGIVDSQDGLFVFAIFALLASTICILAFQSFGSDPRLFGVLWAMAAVIAWRAMRRAFKLEDAHESVDAALKLFETGDPVSVKSLATTRRVLADATAARAGLCPWFLRRISPWRF